MARKLFARENLEADVPEVSEDAALVEETQTIAADDAATNEIEADQEMIENADIAVDAADDIADVAEAQTEEGAGLSPDAAEIADIAIEALAAITGHQRRSVVSVEAFQSTRTRKQATSDLVKELRRFSTLGQEQIAIAQEGMAKRFFEGIRRLFTKISNWEEKVNKVIGNIPETAEGTISDPGWHKYFPIGGGEATGKDVVNFVNNFAKNVASSKFEGWLGKYDKLAREIADAFGDLDTMKPSTATDLIHSMESLAKEVADAQGTFKDKTTYPSSFAKLSQSDAKKLVEAVRKVYPSDAVQEVYYEEGSSAVIDSTIKYINKVNPEVAEAGAKYQGPPGFVLIAMTIDLVKNLATRKEKYRGAVDLTKFTNELIDAASEFNAGLYNLITNAERVVYGSLRYIEQSAGGKATKADDTAE